MSDPFLPTTSEVRKKKLVRWGIGIGLTVALFGPLLIYAIGKVQRASQKAGMG